MDIPNNRFVRHSYKHCLLHTLVLGIPVCLDISIDPLRTQYRQSYWVFQPTFCPFHSFRHTFANYFKQMENIQEFRVSEILGHKGNSTITYSRYGKQSSLESKQQLIESLNYQMIMFDDFQYDSKTSITWYSRMPIIIASHGVRN